MEIKGVVGGVTVESDFNEFPSSASFFSQHLISFDVRSVRYHGDIVGDSNSCKGNSNKGTSTPTPPRNPEVTLWRLSGFSIKILEIIKDCKAATNREICGKLNKSNNYVKQYLYRLRNYGIIYRNPDNWKWILSDLDNGFFSELDHILYIKYNGNTKVTEQEHNGNSNTVLPQVLPINNIPEIKEEPKRKPRKTEQTNLVTLLQQIRQEQIEQGVVEVLVSEVETKVVTVLATWYDKTSLEATGRAYKHFEDEYEFAKTISCNVSELKDALCSLDDKGWVYTVSPDRDKYRRWKIGFTEEFLERVKNR